MKYLFILLVLINGCSRPTENHIDAVFQPYVSAFTDQANSHGRDVFVGSLTIEFGSEPSDVLGKCQSGDGSVITINPNQWDYLSPVIRQVLIFHELGHCVLGRHHLDTNDGPNGVPTSIMTTIMGKEVDYKANWDYYLTELFK